MIIEHGPINNCQFCGQSPLIEIISLGHQAPVHAHLNSTSLHQPETLYPLTLCRCSACGLIQLNFIVDPKTIFYPEYPYFTGMTTMLVNNFRNLRDEVQKMHPLSSESLVVDIGSNDGTLLAGFKDIGAKVLGIEPTNVAKVANDHGIPTVQEFFTQNSVEKIIANNGQADVVTATNMFAHVNNVFPFAQAIANLLKDSGLFISESQYLVDMLEKNALDTIYHEHLRYYSLKPLQKLLNNVGLSLIDAERIEAAGGSIRVYAKKGKYVMSERAKKIMAAEEAMGIYDGRIFENFSSKLIKAKQDLIATIVACRQEGARVFGIGAPGRSNTLLQFAHLDNQLIDYALEKNGSPKIGLYTPGTHIPIVDEEILLSEQPEYGLLLSWHIGQELMTKLRAKGFRGKFICPLPDVKIIAP